MDKYLAITEDIREALSNTSLEIYPEDYKGDISSENRFARYSILMPESEAIDFGRASRVEGMLMVRLFSAAGFAGADSYQDAATLNQTLEYKQFTNRTTFGSSMMAHPIIDSVNESLVMAVYSIPFTYTGE